MFEDQQKRIEEHTNRILEDIDKLTRKIRGDAYRCAANCCDNDTYSKRKVQNCLQDCNNSLNEAEEYAQTELGRVHNRLQRCVMDCNDRIKDLVGPNPTKQDVEKHSAQFDKCVVKCVDFYCETLPNLEKAMKKILSEGQYHH